MTETAQAYPAEWDEVEKGSTEGSKYLKLVTGKPVRVHVVQGPRAAQQVWVEGYPGKDGKTFKKKLTLPPGAQLAGYKLKREFHFEVEVLDGPESGTRKILACGQQIADEFLKIKSAWGSIEEPDIVLSRSGAGQMDTKYSAQGVKPTVKDLKPSFDLGKEVVFSTKEDLDKVPPPPSGSGSDSLEKKASPAQVKMMMDLIAQKDVTHDWVVKTLLRKYNKQELDDLTAAETSDFITMLKVL